MQQSNLLLINFNLKCRQNTICKSVEDLSGAPALRLQASYSWEPNDEYYDGNNMIKNKKNSGVSAKFKSTIVYLKKAHKVLYGCVVETLNNTYLNDNLMIDSICARFMYSR